MKKHLSDKYLSSYVDGDLKPKQKERIEEHLAGCKACSRRLEEFKKIKATAADFKQVEVPDGILVGIRARLANEGQRLGSAIPAKSRRQFGFWHGIAVGFSLTSAVLMFIILPHIGRLDTDQKQHEELTLGFSAEEAGPPLGLARAQNFGSEPSSHQMVATRLDSEPSNGYTEKGSMVFTSMEQIVDTETGDTTPRPCVFMEPLDEEARRRMLTEQGIVEIFPFEGPDLRYTRPQKTEVQVVPVLEADTNKNEKLNRLFYK